MVARPGPGDDLDCPYALVVPVLSRSVPDLHLAIGADMSHSPGSPSRQRIGHHLSAAAALSQRSDPSGRSIFGGLDLAAPAPGLVPYDGT